MLSYTVNEIIESAIQIEKNGYRFYDRAAARDDLSPKTRELLAWLRDQETEHEKTFASLRGTFEKMEMYAMKDWEGIADFIKSNAESHVFNDADAAIRLAVEAKDEDEILRNAVNFEKDTILFFTSFQKDMLDPEAKKVIRRIIDEEATHVVRLRKMIDSLKEG